MFLKQQIKEEKEKFYCVFSYKENLIKLLLYNQNKV